MRAVNVRVSGPMIQEVARRYAQELKVANFQASQGWLEKFKVRHGISQKVLSGESNNVSVTVVEDFVEKFAEFSRGFTDENIFNADECELFFKAMPQKSLVMRGDACKTGKLSKERLTVLLCASLTGEKLKPLVIGKSLKPRAFKNLNPEHLPVTWRSNRRAWMTADLFEEWVRSVDKEMKKKKRSILLTVDNCPSHPQIENLSNVTLKFLPPNTTSRIQPLDQGVIKAFKMHYRAQLLDWVVSKTQRSNLATDASELVGSVNALDSVLWINVAWSKVQAETITKCFRKAGFVTNPKTVITASSNSTFNIGIYPGVDFEAFVTMDDELVTCNEPDAESIFQAVLSDVREMHESVDDLEKEEEESDSDTEVEQILTANEVRHSLHQLKLFAAEKCPDMFNAIVNADFVFTTYVCTKKAKQTTIDSFFTSATIGP